MSLGGVFMTDTDGNIGVEKITLSEKVCGLLFDISAQTDFWTKGPAAELADRCCGSGHQSLYWRNGRRYQQRLPLWHPVLSY